jgi:Spy/CpxP family protein refolding chaperone
MTEMNQPHNQKENPMMLNKRKMILILFCCLFFGQSEIPAMEGFPPPGHPGDGGPLMESIRNIGLSDEQKTGIEAIISKYQSEIKTYMDTIDGLKKEMDLNLFTDEFDETKIREYSQNISANMEELEVLKAKMLVEIKTILYPEQIKQLQEEISEKLNFLEQHQEQRTKMLEKRLE